MALIGGYNTFPINVQGHSDDFLMFVNADNCPKLNTAIQTAIAAYETKTKTQYKEFCD